MGLELVNGFFQINIGYLKYKLEDFICFLIFIYIVVSFKGEGIVEVKGYELILYY